MLSVFCLLWTLRKHGFRVVNCLIGFGIFLALVCHVFWSASSATYPRTNCWIIDAPVDCTERERGREERQQMWASEKEQEQRDWKRAVKEIGAFLLNPTRIHNTRYFYLFRHRSGARTRAWLSMRTRCATLTYSSAHEILVLHTRAHTYTQSPQSTGPSHIRPF